jgi:hypothetical protein
MRLVPIQSIAMNSAGELLVRPMSPHQWYEFIYREGNGLRWDAREQALVAAEPSRWEYPELFWHIVQTVRNACDEHLHLTGDTVWENVPPEVETRLREVSSER